MISAIQSVSSIDTFTDSIVARLRLREVESGFGQCEMEWAEADGRFATRCHRTAVVTDLDSELSLCAHCAWVCADLDVTR